MKLMSAKFLVSLSLLALTVSPVLAVRGENLNPQVTAQTIETSPSASPTRSPNPGKIQACEAKLASIQNRMTNLTRMANNMLNVFNSIAQRVMTFYTGKVVPTGKTVANYDTLVSDMQTKNSVVQTALIKTQNDASTFSCQSGNAKAQVTSFRADMQAVKTALKNYRTSIRNLIVAVRGAAIKANLSASPSATPTGTAVPTVTP